MEYIQLDKFQVALEHDYYGNEFDYYYSVIPDGILYRAEISNGFLSYGDSKINVMVEGTYIIDIIVGSTITIVDVVMAKGQYVWMYDIRRRLETIVSLPLAHRILLSSEDVIQFLHRDIIFCDRSVEYGNTFVIRATRDIIITIDRDICALYDLNYQPAYEGRTVLYSVSANMISHEVDIEETSYENLSRILDNDCATLSGLKHYLENKVLQVAPLIPLDINGFISYITTVHSQSPYFASVVSYVHSTNCISAFELSRLENLKAPVALTRRGLKVDMISTIAYVMYVGYFAKNSSVGQKEDEITSALTCNNLYVHSNYIPRDLDVRNYVTVLKESPLVSNSGVDDPLVLTVFDNQYRVFSDTECVLRGLCNSISNSTYSVLSCCYEEEKYTIIDCLIFRGRDIRHKKLSERLVYRDIVNSKDLGNLINFRLKQYIKLSKIISSCNYVYFFPDSPLEAANYGVYEWSDRNSMINEIYRYCSPVLKDYIRSHPRLVYRIEREVRSGKKLHKDNDMIMRLIGLLTTLESLSYNDLKMDVIIGFIQDNFIK